MAVETTAPSSTQDTQAATDTRRPVVACQQLTKTFKDFWMRDQAKAVDKLDLVVREKEIFGLLGPNGSGKSTTIKLILGLLKPTSGRVMVFDKPTTHVATKSRIGYLPEESYLYPFLNARETLDYYGKLFRLDSKTRKLRIDELLEMVGLEHAQFRPVREYSKGMQRRIGIAQALINDPDLLILDEPTTGLDPIGTRQVKDLILELGRRGKSIILSSHLLTDVEDVVDRMVILYGGKIRGEGTCEELLSSKERTTIESDELDDETIAEIDEIIRRRSSGNKSILSVSSPRQRLEELFLGIVERAQTERTSTSGATQGGETASFLRSEEAAIGGAALIDSLLDAGGPANDSTSESGSASDPTDPSTPTPAEPVSSAPEKTEDQDVISSLLTSDDPEPIEDSNPTSGTDSNTSDNSQPAEEDVDTGIIDSLLGGDPTDENGTEPENPTDRENNR
ncbi:MAG: ATP-binding cassette domain-containing protein [Phycisphaerales bacterium]|nr:ATP-binding cassette domain-containing protein [Phycisphaerales bacterium]